jgi:hypothetical protein
MLTSGSDTFNRMNAAIFRSPTLSRLFYPILRAGRNATLRALGRTKVRPPTCDARRPSTEDARL